MAQPTPFTPTTDFSDEAANAAAGRATVNPTKLDTEFANLNLTLDETLTNLALIQRDDGKIRDGKVELHTLSAQVRALFAAGGATVRGDWVTATAYVLNDIVTESDATYICATAHTSGTFATDLAADKWVRIANAPDTFTAADITNTPAGSIAATNVQDAINELDGDIATVAAAVLAIEEVPLAGGTMTGLLVLSGDPVAALGAVPKQYADDVINGLHACAGYFFFVSSTQLRLSRDVGSKIFIEGEWYDIPAAGANLSNSGLAANTVYRVYAFFTGGGVTLEASTDPRATDATFGHQIRSGQPSRTLVGMCRTNASAQFYDSPDIGVLSYYNRRQKIGVRPGPTGGGNFVTLSTSYVAISPFVALNWLTWGQDSTEIQIVGYAFATAGAVNCTCVPGIDGVATGYATQASAHAANYFMNLGGAQIGVYSEGNHTADVRVATNGFSVTYQSSGSAVIVKVHG